MGIVVLGILVSSVVGGREPDVGLLPPLEARPAEMVEIRSLGAGQTFGQVLEGAIGASEQNTLLMAFREQASPRRMRVGTEIALRYTGAADAPALRAVDVTLNADETVRLTRVGRGWRSQTVQTPTWTDTIYAAGQIKNVLWNAVVDNEALAELPVADRAKLIDHLDRIFQWQIDFSRQIQVGDSYRFAFERDVRPDGSMRAGRVLSAELVNVGSPIYAVRFDPNGDGDGTYYDLDGQSVRRAFLRKPLEFRRISSRFSGARFHPILNRVRAHNGVDYAADRGTPIMATSDGTVTQRGPDGGLGNAVTLRHANGFQTRYGHMSAIASSVRLGGRVSQGDIIGYVGATGLATGPHLHYELWRNGRPVDPLSIDLPAGDPVPGELEDEWAAQLAGALELLEALPSPVALRMATADEAPEGEEDSSSGATGGSDL